MTGVERLQPPTYYALASLPFRLTDGGTDRPTRLFLVRLLSALAGAVTAGGHLAGGAAAVARAPLLALPAAGVATLAPGHLFLLASVNNDPLATALASVAVLGALHFWWPTRRGRALLWRLSGALAVAPS